MHETESLPTLTVNLCPNSVTLLSRLLIVNHFGLSKTAILYMGCECERYEVLLVDSDDSMTSSGIKLVNLHEFAQGFWALMPLYAC